jgi:CHAT domain-containing protein
MARTDLAETQARHWIATGEPPVADLPHDDAAALRLAWALKDACYAAWNSEPQTAARAADALETLHARSVDRVAAAAASEISALAHWTRAIAHLAAGAMADAIGSLDAAADTFTALGRAADAAQTRVPRIMALSMLGRHDEAVACAEDAQRRFTALGDRRSAAKTSLNLGSLHLRHDAYADAARHYRLASVLFARIADREHSVMADIGIADALSALGEIDEAARIYARARMRAATHGLPVLEAVVDESTALLDLACGRYGEALAGFERARRRYEALAMPQHLAIAEKQLGDAYLELRLLPEALALYGPALARMDALQMPDDAAWTLAQRGRAQALLGDPAAAGASFDLAEQAFAAQRSAVGSAAVRLARAELALASGDPAHAAQDAAAAAQGFGDAGLVAQRLRAETVEAQAALRRGLPGRATARAALARLLDSARQAQLLSLQVRCLTGLGDAALADADRAAARTAYRSAIDLFEEQRSALVGDDVRIAFLTNHLRPYDAMLGLALDDQAHSPSPEHAAEVLRWLDRTRARALDERLAQGRGEAEGDAVPPAVAALRARLHWLNRRLQQREDDDGTVPSELEAARREAEQALLEAARRARLAEPQRRSAAAPADIAAALASRLAHDDALVEYGTAGGRLFACVVRRDTGIAVVALAPLADVRTALEAVRFQIETLRHGADRLAGHLDRLAARTQVHLQRLHGLVWAPLMPALAGARRVMIVAHGALGGLPFAALHDGGASLDAQFLLAHAPSARWACDALARTPRAPRSALVVAESSRLAHTRAEVRAVAARFARATVVEHGSLAALVRHAPEADALHLACHAEFRADNPMFSALHLDDAPLSVERAEGLVLAAGSSVVLSACETGLAGDGAGDEHLGLVRAFFVAGAARVLASLWPVDDRVTAAFMEVYYSALTAGQPPAAALHAAQAAVRRTHPHPYFWAAFALYGGW